ncbi:MAG: glycosyltransferase family 4 protein [Bacteroidota bacterium]
MALKILFLSHKFFPDIGGIESISEIFANGFSNAGHDVHLLTWSTDDTGKEFPYKVVRNPGVASLFKEHAWADVVFENNPCFRMAWPAIFFKRPSVISLQTWTVSGKNGPQEKLKDWWLKRAFRVISCSEAIRKICWPKSVVIGNPYKTETFRTISGADKRDGFVFLGRLVSDKGVDIIVTALHKLLSAPNTKGLDAKQLSLTIVGNGDEKAPLEKMVSELGLQQHVTFTGPLRGDALVSCLNKHRFLVAPSRWEEPFGIVALEGMACGCVPIVSDGGGLPDAVGNAGLVFKSGDADDLVAIIKKVLENPALEDGLKQAAPAHLALHSGQEVTRRYLQIIEQSCNVEPVLTAPDTTISNYFFQKK